MPDDVSEAIGDLPLPADCRDADRNSGSEVLGGVPLTDQENTYVRAVRAGNTLWGYRSDRREFPA